MLSLPEQLRSTLEEARILLPGIQALFGFQLIAVFSAHFDNLTRPEKLFHLAATGLTLISIAMSLTPTALHRQTMPHAVSQKLVDSTSKFLTYSLVPLILGSTIEMKLLSRLILQSEGGSFAVAALSFVLLTSLWILFPQIYGSKLRADRSKLGKP